MKIDDIKELRVKLEQHFSKDTANIGTASSVSSAGHCAVVAIISHILFDAKIVSATVQGQSHWFNRIVIDNDEIDFDITGDQFGFSQISISKANCLYPNTRLRDLLEANEETVKRARLLACRAGLLEVNNFFDKANK